MLTPTSVLASVLAVLAPVPKQAPPMAPAAFLEECRRQEAALAKFFADPEVWQPERKADLMLHLRVAGVVRPKEILPSLLAHLNYRDDSVDRSAKPPSPEVEFPVFAALKGYGAVAIPELIIHLKKAPDPEDDRQARIVSYLCVQLLCDSSDNREVGASMARTRIRHEIDQFPKADFPRLKALLDSPLLK